MFNLVEKINNTCCIPKTLAMLDWSLQNNENVTSVLAKVD
jgi:hypothetical protein